MDIGKFMGKILVKSRISNWFRTPNTTLNLHHFYTISLKEYVKI